MSKRILTLTLPAVALALAHGFVRAEPPAPVPPIVHGPPNATLVAQGTLARFTINPFGEVDGFLLADGTQVTFPSHMSAELIAAVNVGDAVSVQGMREYSGAVKAWIVTNTHTHAVVAEHPPQEGRPPLPPHLRQAALSPLEVQGKIHRTLSGPRGEVNGVLLEDGSIVRFPPDIGVQYRQLLQPGAAFAARGYGTQNQFRRALEATAIGTSSAALRPIYAPPILESPGAAP